MLFRSIRLVSVSDSPLFKHGPTFGAIGQLVKKLHYPSEMVAPLDTSPHLHKVINFTGPALLDFNMPPPQID